MLRVGNRIRRISAPKVWSPLGDERVVISMNNSDGIGYEAADGIKSFLIEREWELIEEENMTTKAEWKTLPAGTKLRCIKGFKDYSGARLIEGQEYEFVRYSTTGPGGIVTKGCSLHPNLDAVNWGDGCSKDGSEHFEVVVTELSFQEQLDYFQARKATHHQLTLRLADIEDELDAIARALIPAAVKEFSND